MRLRFLTLALPLAFAWGAHAQTASELDREGLKAYQAKEFARAADLFERALAQPGAEPDSAYNGACAASLAGQKERALTLLEKAVALGASPTAEQIEKDADFASLRSEARFTRSVEAARDRERVRAALWDSPALATGYRDSLSEDEKVAGLSKLWAEVRFNFVYPETLAALDWDRLYLEALPRVRAARSTLEYYRTLQVLIAKLRDGHTNVYPPAEVMARLEARPALRTGLVEGRVLVFDVLDPELRAAGLVRGDEIVTVDGLPVRDHAAAKVAPYESTSTPQDLDGRVYGWSLLRGAPAEKVRLGIRTATGVLREVTARRLPAAERKGLMPAPPPFELTMLPGNVALVALNAFDDDTAADEYLKAFPRVAAADAVIFDVRRNGGGNSNVGYRVLATLTDRPFETSRWATRDYKPAFRAWRRADRFHDGGAGAWDADGTRRFTKPVVVLSGPSTFSAAEDFLVAFDVMKRGRIVGEPSGGSTGQPLFFKLPGGGSARVCTKRDTYPDGKAFVGVGVQPQVVVRPTVADVRAGRDTVLEAALASLKEAR